MKARTSDLNDGVLATPQRLGITHIASALLKGGPHPICHTCTQCAYGGREHHMPHGRHGVRPGRISDPPMLICFPSRPCLSVVLMLNRIQLAKPLYVARAGTRSCTPNYSVMNRGRGGREMVIHIPHAPLIKQR